ncbi:hypothetical protein NRB20_48000 [Nocardia sp. RB20]|uniref:Uncharacterized protein n=1 Tax=Nocardia macrotermitis TaxID=2585198 RepID=A0A7K0D7J7_9NOCA|nr:hypothetical protein [Nocardia macrotermitis]
MYVRFSVRAPALTNLMFAARMDDPSAAPADAVGSRMALGEGLK